MDPTGESLWIGRPSIAAGLIGVGKPGFHRLPSLRTGRAVLPHPALQSVVNSIMEIGAHVPKLF